MKKRFVIVFIAVLCLLGFIGCGNNSEAEKVLDYETYKFFERDVLASNLFYQRTANKSKTKPVNEFTHQMVIL